MEITISDFLNICILRNQIITLSDEELKNLYNDRNTFVAFLNTFCATTQLDTGFLLFDDKYIDKIQRIISNNRFKYDEEEIKRVCNDAIVFLNNYKYMDEKKKKIMKGCYLTFQEDCRRTNFYSENSFIKTLAYDGACLLELMTGEKYEQNDEYFLCSVNYFMAMIPELFDSQEVYDRAASRIDEIGNNRHNKRRKRNFSKKTKMALQYIKQKEE